MSILPPSPFVSVSPGAVANSLPSGENDPSVTKDCVPGESSSSLTERRVSEAPAVAASNPMTAGLLQEENYIPELFSVYARRRCMPIISPPLPPREYVVDMDALYDAIVPPEPPPVFLRSPSQNFIRALFELGR